MKKIKKIALIVLSFVFATSMLFAIGCGKSKSISLSETELSLALFESQQLTIYKGEEPVTAIWSSSNETAVSVTQEGVVKAEAIGSATITAKVDNKEVTCVVTVTQGTKVATLDIVDEVTVMKNQSLDFTPRFTYDGKTEEIPANITYTPSDTTNIDVIKNDDLSMTITGKAKTTQPVTITVVCEWHGIVLNKTISVTVVDNVVISLSKNAIDLYSVAWNEYLTEDTIAVSQVIDDDVPISNPAISYASEDSSIATVDQNGKITAVSKGSTFIKVIYTDEQNDQHYAYCGVTVSVTEVDFSDTSIGDIYKVSSDGTQTIDLSDFDISVDAEDMQFSDITNANTPFAIDSTKESDNCWTLDDEDLVGGKNRIFLAEVENVIKVKFSANVISKVITCANDFNNLEDYSTVTNRGTWKDSGKPVYTYDGYFVLNSNIDLSDEVISTNLFSTDEANTNFDNYGEYGFIGEFDGRGYTMYDGVFSAGGMFGTVGVKGVLKNFAIVNATLDRSAWDSSGHIMCCAIANCFMGTLENAIIEFTGQTGTGNMCTALAQYISGGSIKDVVVYTNEATNLLATYIWDRELGGTVAENVYVFASHEQICNTWLQSKDFKVGEGVTIYPYDATCAEVDLTALDGENWVLTGKKVRFASSCEATTVYEYEMYTGLDADNARIKNTNNLVIDLTNYNISNDYTISINGVDITNKTTYSDKKLTITPEAFTGVVGSETTFNIRSSTAWVEMPVKLYTAILTTANDIFYLQNYADKVNETVSSSVAPANKPIYEYGGYFVLGGNITLNGKITTDFGYEWSLSDPSGSADYVNKVMKRGFTGTFDGRGYTLNGGTYYEGGLFGSVATSGVVKNLSIRGAMVARSAWAGAGHNMSSVMGGMFAGTMDNVIIEITYNYNDTGNMGAIIAGKIAGATIKNTIIYCEGMNIAENIYKAGSNGLANAKAENVILVSDMTTITNAWLQSPQFAVGAGVTQYAKDTACSNIDFSGFASLSSYWNFTGAKAVMIPN